MPLSLLPLLQTAVAPSAEAATVGTGKCAQTVSTTTGVSVAENANDECVLTFSVSGVDVTWTVPSGGLTNVAYTIKGGRGGSSGASGANYSGTIVSLSSSQQLTIQVGRDGTANSTSRTYPNGGHNNNGGGTGGGATQVFDAVKSSDKSTRVLVAGGGGGAGLGSSSSTYEGKDADGSTGGAAGSVAGCSMTVDSGSSTGVGGITNARSAGAGGGGYAGGGGGGYNSADADPDYRCGDNIGMKGGRGSSYVDPVFATASSGRSVLRPHLSTVEYLGLVCSGTRPAGSIHGRTAGHNP